ncbi:MAG TPA: RDD family protein [Gaiellaceae bacterium]|nr:RDD family protein [Gaiellaceae bacterium]
MSQGSWGFDPDAEDAMRTSALDIPAARTYDLASWGRRVGGYLVDVVVLMLGLVAVGIGFAISDALGAILIVVWIAAGLLGYWVLFEGSASGQTPGKRAVGIRVRADDGGRAGYGKALVRNLVARVIGLFPFVGLIDVLWPLWDNRNQCLHDKAASTIVIRT